MAAIPNPIAHPNLKSKRTAMLVVHGIGEQNPYETLDSFTRGVYTYLRTNRSLNANLCPIEIAHKEWTQVGMRIEIFPPLTSRPACPNKDEIPPNPRPQPEAYVDLFEYYWAPETEDKLNAIQTLKWVLRTDLTPLRYFADNLQETMNVRRWGFGRALWGSLRLYFQELMRVIFLYGPLAVVIALLINWLAKPHSYANALKNITTQLMANLVWPRPVILGLYLLFLMLVWFGVQFLGELHQHRGKAIEKQGERLWFVGNVILAILFFAAGFTIDALSGSWVGSTVLRVLHRNWFPLVCTVLAAFLTYFLTAYVADVAVYVNADAKTKNYAARSAILKGSTAALKTILASDLYDRIILAGHSLGSVIAYDTINELLAQYNAAPGPGADCPDPALHHTQLQKLKGLVTFGSPLDKIYYFFREHVKRDQAIRAQILSMLHSFRKYPSGRDYEDFEFNYAFRQLDGQDGLVWLNAWARLDPVSTALKFYVVDDQRQFSYSMPIWAHLSYWGDPNFYNYFCGRLL
jgi:hypothetical protein